MTMRRETIRALEVRKNSVMAERRKSQMQTLGANNEYGVTTSVSVQHMTSNPHTRTRTAYSHLKFSFFLSASKQ